MKNISLASSLKLSSMIALLATTGCAEYHKRVLKCVEDVGPEFTTILAEEYDTLCNTEQDIMYDECSANYYYVKAIRAKRGFLVEPTVVECRNIDEEKLPELEEARDRLMRALEFGAAEVAPKMTAHAQA